ncbi:MAG: hypothetical protein EH225_08620 [Calditrichaeota bacterium]|nr:hypothetical protein [Spirochaetales bacterium]RQW02333.1 MAG: hypothetical protein EH225_08620 [Calditrichota bacterium]
MKIHNSDRDDKIISKYPDLFPLTILIRDNPFREEKEYHQRIVDFICGDGWMELIDKACEELSRIPGTTVLLVKEIFGKLQFSLSGPKEAQDIALRTEREACTVCERCGTSKEDRITVIEGIACGYCDECLEKARAAWQYPPRFELFTGKEDFPTVDDPAYFCYTYKFFIQGEFHIDDCKDYRFAAIDNQDVELIEDLLKMTNRENFSCEKFSMTKEQVLLFIGHLDERIDLIRKNGFSNYQSDDEMNVKRNWLLVEKKTEIVNMLANLREWLEDALSETDVITITDLYV